MTSHVYLPEEVVEDPGVGPGGEEGVLPADEVKDGDIVPGVDAVLEVTMVVVGVLRMMMDSVGGEEGNTVVTGVDGFVGGLEGVWLLEDVGVVFSVEVEVGIGVSKVVAEGVGVSVMMEVDVGPGEGVMVVAVIGEDEGGIGVVEEVEVDDSVLEDVGVGGNVVVGTGLGV